MAKHRSGRHGHVDKNSSGPGHIKRRTAHAASLAKQNLWERAVAELSELPGLDIIAFNAAFAACKGRWSAAASLLHVMAFSRVELDAIAATGLLKSYATGTAWCPVLSLLDGMAGSNIQQDAYLLTAAISACESSCAWKHAAEIQAQSVFLSTSLVAWNACLAASAAAAMWCLGLGMLQQLPVYTLQKDVVSCSSVLHACSLGKRWRNALEIFANMSTRGPRPNVIACGAAISAASNSARGGPWALTTLKNMQMQRLKPSVVCFNAALSACASSFMWEECLALLRTMQHDKVQPTMVSFGAAMSAVEKVERWTDALELLTEAFPSGLQPSLVACSSAIAACKHEPAAWRQAIQLTRCKRSEIWPPNLILANSLSSACESAGKWQQCTVILTSLPTWRLETEEQTYGSIVSAMAASAKDENEQWNMKTARWKVSIQLLDQLQATDLEIDVVYLGFALNLCEATVSDGRAARSDRSPVPTDAAVGSGRSLMALLRMVEDCGERSLRCTV
eukprot:Skav212037  [mRNA]  locus=scaffold782:66608:68128:+ [translate_table: standard]